MSTRIIDGIDACVSALAEFNCRPTFFIPAAIVQKYPALIRRLRQAGVEIAVHGFHHLDLSVLPVDIALDALQKSTQILQAAGIEAFGFRGPYLGCSDALLESLPTGLFTYSSNVAIYWNHIAPNRPQTSFSKTLNHLYQVKPSPNDVSIPRLQFGIVEIPACIPDDLQLHDGFKMPPSKIFSYWRQMLREIHKRGELFTLVFHSELASICARPLGELLREIPYFTPAVWVARMSEICDWWLRKSSFNVEIVEHSDKTSIRFNCSDDATILFRGLEIEKPCETWDNKYNRLLCKEIRLEAGTLPFIGLTVNTPIQIKSFLQNLGYIVVTDGLAQHCATIIDQNVISELHSGLDIAKYIANSSNPLIRFGYWPNGAKSALSITGDIDALSLFDYADRFFHIR
jgi:peptidoglycan/xylan/chitin deacetylase (PgdA/CDA1 family)